MRLVQLTTPSQGVDVEYLSLLHNREYGEGRDYDVKAVGQACIRCVMDSKREHLNCWIVYLDNDPVGYLAGTIHQSFYSFSKYAVQEMWYVVPSARGSRGSLLLLAAFERWAIDKGVERIYTQVEHDNNEPLVERIFKLLLKLGYKKQGYVAVKIVPQHKDKEHVNDRTSHRELGAE